MVCNVGFEIDHNIKKVLPRCNLNLVDTNCEEFKHQYSDQLKMMYSRHRDFEGMGFVYETQQKTPEEICSIESKMLDLCISRTIFDPECKMTYREDVY